MTSETDALPTDAELDDDPNLPTDEELDERLIEVRPNILVPNLG